MYTSSKIKQEPLALLLGREEDARYFHLNCQIVRWTSDEKIRNITDSGPVNGFLRLHDLCCTSQGQNDEPTRLLHSWMIRYMQPYAVDYSEAEKMYRTLRKLLDKLDKLTVKRGHPKSYADFIGRFGEVIGATEVFYRVSGDKGYYDDNEYARMPLGEGINYIDALVQRWQRGELLND